LIGPPTRKRISRPRGETKQREVAIEKIETTVSKTTRKEVHKLEIERENFKTSTLGTTET